MQDAEASAKFYQDVFRWSVWYDNVLHADHRFPPSGAEDQAKVRLIVLQAQDAQIGKLGLLQYLDSPFAPDQVPASERRRVRMGETILVLSSTDVDGVYQRALTAGAEVVTSPVDWFVPGPDGSAQIHLRTVSFFDPNGIYMEVSDHPSST